MRLHTPGPWTVEKWKPRTWTINAPSWTRFVDVYGNTDPQLHAQGEANARLIAAAPRMLAELKDMYAAHVYGEHGRNIGRGEAGCSCDWYTETRAILRDVEGESHA